MLVSRICRDAGKMETTIVYLGYIGLSSPSSRWNMALSIL